MQCKDIPDYPILALMASSPAGTWHNWYFWDSLDVTRAMPSDVPPKLKIAKMRGLIRRGLVDGCPCGCRGDFRLTDDGFKWVTLNG